MKERHSYIYRSSPLSVQNAVCVLKKILERERSFVPPLFALLIQERERVTVLSYLIKARAPLFLGKDYPLPETIFLLFRVSFQTLNMHLRDRGATTLIDKTSLFFTTQKRARNYSQSQTRKRKANRRKPSALYHTYERERSWSQKNGVRVASFFGRRRSQCHPSSSSARRETTTIVHLGRRRRRESVRERTIVGV